MENLGKINIAVVGCGMLAQGQHLPHIVSNPKYNLKWCCDISQENLRICMEKFKPEKITVNAKDVANDPNCPFVVIATHESVRKDLIILFANAGKHIYAEKPLANKIDEVNEIYKIVKKTEIGFCLGHNRRCAPAIREARKIYLKHKANPVNPAWRWDREKCGGPSNEWNKRTLILLRVNDDALSWKKFAFVDGTLYCEMTHFVDLACYMTGLKPAYVTVVGDPTTNFSVHSINIEFEDGSLGVCVSCTNGTYGYPKELVEIFYGGAAIIVEHCIELKVAGIESEPFWRTYPLAKDSYSHIYSDGGIKDFYMKTIALHQDMVKSNSPSDLGIWPNKGHALMLEEFVNAVLAGKPGPSPIDDSVISTTLIFKAVESAKAGGKRIPVNIDSVLSGKWK